MTDDEHRWIKEQMRLAYKQACVDVRAELAGDLRVGEHVQRPVGVPVPPYLVGQLGERGQRPGAGPGGRPEDLPQPRQPEPVPWFQVQRLGLVEQLHRGL